MKYSRHKVILRPPRINRRDGMSLLIVVLLVSVTTVLSYVVLRGQSSAAHIQRNSDLSASARRAAMTGLTYGIRSMHTASWSGVNSTQTRTLGAHESFTVSFAVGDASLGQGSIDYEDYPYRVTVQSTGYAEDPVDLSREASHTVHAVMRLIPRALSTWPDWPANRADWPVDWHKMEGYTVYQTEKNDTYLRLPCRIEGNVRLQDTLFIAKDYPDDDARKAYLEGLNQMRLDGLADYRPLTGTIRLPYSFPYTYQTYYDFWEPNSYLGFSYDHIDPDEVASDWVMPSGLTTYQIYPGGPVYEIVSISGDQEDVSLESDPVNNPLGFFHHSGGPKLKGNVFVRGSLFCNGNVDIEGSVQFESVDMPALCGSETPIRLPVFVANDVNVKPVAMTTIEGLVAVFNQLMFEDSSTARPFALTGRLITPSLIIGRRMDWEVIDWEECFEDFDDDGSQPYFPIWMISEGCSPNPTIVIKPDATPIQYDWNNWNNPIYVPHVNDDGGLRWEMLKWNEGSP
ncbi:MAG: hypothetical protein JW888_17685 [Pirellulales bacterium]|nr:hypothetical protein [Pirellulales bacterium]